MKSSDSPTRAPRLIELDARYLRGPQPDEAGWYAALRGLLEEAYLATDDSCLQSGTRSNAARWERGRRPIAAAIHRDGAFLDVACANGLLMETLTEWAKADGHHSEPYGLDFSEAIAALARQRLPQWADRIFVGNVIDWQPPFGFDFVRTELEYVPPHRQPELVARLLTTFLAPSGRLIVCSYGSSRRPAPRVVSIGDMLRGWGRRVAGEAGGADLNGVRIVRVAWVDATTRPRLPVQARAGSFHVKHGAP